MPGRRVQGMTSRNILSTEGSNERNVRNVKPVPCLRSDQPSSCCGYRTCCKSYPSVSVLAKLSPALQQNECCSKPWQRSGGLVGLVLAHSNYNQNGSSPERSILWTAYTYTVALFKCVLSKYEAYTRQHKCVCQCPPKYSHRCKNPLIHQTDFATELWHFQSWCGVILTPAANSVTVRFRFILLCAVYSRSYKGGRRRLAFINIKQFNSIDRFTLLQKQIRLLSF